MRAEGRGGLGVPGWLRFGPGGAVYAVAVLAGGAGAMGVPMTA